MKSSGVRSLLRAIAALPGAGAAVDCTAFRCELCDSVAVDIQYTSVTALGAVQVNIDRIVHTEFWTGMNTRSHGVKSAGGLYVAETVPLQGPGAVATINYSFEVVVLPGTRFLQLSVQEIGDIANPGTCGVAATGGMQ